MITFCLIWLWFFGMISLLVMRQKVAGVLDGLDLIVTAFWPISMPVMIVCEFLLMLPRPRR